MTWDSVGTVDHPSRRHRTHYKLEDRAHHENGRLSGLLGLFLSDTWEALLHGRPDLLLLSRGAVLGNSSEGVAGVRFVRDRLFSLPGNANDFLLSLLRPLVPRFLATLPVSPSAYNRGNPADLSERPPRDVPSSDHSHVPTLDVVSASGC